MAVSEPTVARHRESKTASSTAQPDRGSIAFLAALLVIAGVYCAYKVSQPKSEPGLATFNIQQREPARVSTEIRKIDVKLLDESITVLPSVFTPFEAETFVLPLMADNPDLFRNKTVMEIGTGSGVIALYAAKLGAKKVIATDINEKAIENVRLNAEKLGLSHIIDARLVEMSEGAFDRVPEQLDIIIANPPYSLDLDADRNSEVTDSGDLGFSIVNGLPQKLLPEGKALLLYNSYFFHHVIVRYARHRNYDVVHHNAPYMTRWEVDALFNGYASRIGEREQLDANALQFDHTKEAIGSVQIVDGPQPRMLANPEGVYPGMVVISLKP